MVQLNVIRPRYEDVLAHSRLSPRLTASQVALIGAAWLAMMAGFLWPVMVR
jgi:hypothetical protein